MRNVYLKRRDGLDDVGVGGEMDLIEIPWEGVDGVGRVATCLNTNEPSGSTEGEEFLEELLEYKLVKKDSVSWSSISAWV
jgi:hypothetical protein